MLANKFPLYVSRSSFSARELATEQKMMTEIHKVEIYASIFLILFVSSIFIEYFHQTIQFLAKC